MDGNIEKINDSAIENVPQYKELENNFNNAFKIVDDVVLKNYITKLKSMDIIPLSDEILENNISNNVRLFKINEMVYQNDEYSTYKFASVFNAAASTQSTLFIIIDSDGEKTEFYMGIKSNNPDRSTKTSYDTLANSMKGQFPGIKTTNLFDNDMKDLFGKIQSQSISVVTGIANSKEKEKSENRFFIQGLEKLALSMQGERYTGIIIANTIEHGQLSDIRSGYEDIYTKLSPYANFEVSYGTNSTLNISSAYTEGTTIGENTSTSNSETKSEGSTTSTSTSNSKSRETLGSIAGKTVGSALTLAGAAVGSVVPGVGTIIGGACGNVLGSIVTGSTHRTVSESESVSSTHNESKSEAFSETHGTSSSVNKGITNTEGMSTGSNNNIQLNIQNKSIINCLDRIDKQLDRLNESESVGMWECAAYFLSENSYASEMAASSYKALMRGENSGVEVSAINVWNKTEKEKTKLLRQYVTNFIHPVFKYSSNGIEIPVTPASLVSGNELAIHMGLPRKSVCGFPVIEHADFGKEIVSYNSKSNNNINLGRIFNMGAECNNSTLLDIQSLSMHTFITGSTGSGKSNAVYEIIDQLDTVGIKYLIIEPAKGEYKNIFGNRKDVTVLGTNPNVSELIKINPFKFPKEIHVLEHIDRLLEIFNACWDMYAAMPAVLKEAIIKSYEDSGWDLLASKNMYSDDLFPTFHDLLTALEEVIEQSAFSEELKSNYTGALVTRVKSITNGLNGKIFSACETDNNILFDSNTIVDLSRMGALESKSLIMGILIMRLNEHRMCNSNEMNLPLKHVTILEEAHNILKKSSNMQGYGVPDLTGKSVEMISNSIAEMRTYGEGFIIIDQSPNVVDASAIRNTNTKIILRLPDEMDRQLVGKSAGMKDEQLSEIAKLPKGVAVVYQNDWVEPVLCKINKFDGKEEKYNFNNENIENDKDEKLFNALIIKFLLQNRVIEQVDIDINNLETLLINANISTKNKIIVHTLIREYKETNTLSIWSEDNFYLLSDVISSFINGRSIINKAVKVSKDFDDLTKNTSISLKRVCSELSDEFCIAITQCLLKNISMENSENADIYSAWVTNMRRQNG